MLTCFCLMFGWNLTMRGWVCNNSNVMFRNTKTDETTVEILSYNDMGSVSHQPESDITMPNDRGSAWGSALYENLDAHNADQSLEIHGPLASNTMLIPTTI